MQIGVLEVLSPINLIVKKMKGLLCCVIVYMLMYVFIYVHLLALVMNYYVYWVTDHMLPYEALHVYCQ